MRYFLYVAPVAVLAALSSPVRAADLPAMAAPPVFTADPPGFNWTGFYAGAFAGANIAASRVGIPLYPSKFTLHATAADIGGKVGYNYQISSFVLGIEGAGSAVFNSKSGPSGAPGEFYHIRQDFAADVVGKLGYAMGRTLFYAKGGGAFADLPKLQFLNDIPVVPNQKHTRYGWTVGGGIDYAMTNHINLGIDYAHSDFGKGKYFYLGPVNVSHTTDAVNVSLSYKFGEPAPVIARY